MKLYKALFTLFFISILLFIMGSCERDDICAADTPTTPLLIIKFFDNETKLEIKQPEDLSITLADSSITDQVPDVVSRDSIMIPLKTDNTITEFNFTINTNDDSDPSLVVNDIVSFQYTTQQEYVSSACGFKVNYLGLTSSAATNNWVKEIEIIRENITDEASAHILIYH